MNVTPEYLIRITDQVIAKLHRKGLLKGYDYADEDIRQEGYLAAIEASARWNEDQGKLSTFLAPRVRGAVIDYVNRERNHGMASKHGTVDVSSIEDAAISPTSSDELALSEDEVYGNRMDDLAYDDSIFSSIPDIFQDVELITDRSIINAIVEGLRPSVRVPVQMYFGLGKWYGKPQPLSKIAKRYNRSVSGQHKKVYEAIAYIRDLVYPKT